MQIVLAVIHIYRERGSEKTEERFCSKMDSALAISATALPLFTLSKVNRHFITHNARSFLRHSSSQRGTLRLSSICSHNNDALASSPFLCTVAPLLRRRLECVSSSAASFETSSSGGGGGGGEFGSGGGGGGSDGGDAESNSVAGAVGAEEVSALSPDVIILDVGVRSLKQTLVFVFILNNHYYFTILGGEKKRKAKTPLLCWQGMTCGGCAASVKRILESQVRFHFLFFDFFSGQ